MLVVLDDELKLMESWMPLVVVCWFVILLGQLHVSTVKAVGLDGTQKMTFKPPNVSDEEKHSNFMPEQLKCDACRVVAYQVSQYIKRNSKMFDVGLVGCNL